MKTGASFARHRSKQDIGTPPEFKTAVEKRFGALAFDLAANEENTLAPYYYTEADNSLEQDWSAIAGNLWLNCPFGAIGPWARKCAERRFDSRWTLLLVPASVGSNWYQRYVKPNAMVYELVDRITFVGQSIGYPKDLVCAAFGFGVVGSTGWHWDLSKKKRTDD